MTDAERELRLQESHDGRHGGACEACWEYEHREDDFPPNTVRVEYENPPRCGHEYTDDDGDIALDLTCGKCAVNAERARIARDLYAEAVRRSASPHGNVWSVVAQEIAECIRRDLPFGRGGELGASHPMQR